MNQGKYKVLTVQPSMQNLNKSIDSHSPSRMDSYTSVLNQNNNKDRNIKS